MMSELGESAWRSKVSNCIYMYVSVIYYIVSLSQRLICSLCGSHRDCMGYLD